MRHTKITLHSLVSKLMHFTCEKVITHNILVVALEHVLHSGGAYTSFNRHFLPAGTI